MKYINIFQQNNALLVNAQQHMADLMVEFSAYILNNTRLPIEQRFSM
jgi:hypothetical protein